MIASQSQIKAPGVVAASGHQPAQMKMQLGSKSTSVNGRLTYYLNRDSPQI